MRGALAHLMSGYQGHVDETKLPNTIGGPLRVGHQYLLKQIRVSRATCGRAVLFVSTQADFLSRAKMPIEDGTQFKTEYPTRVWSVRWSRDNSSHLG